MTSSVRCELITECRSEGVSGGPSALPTTCSVPLVLPLCTSKSSLVLFALLHPLVGCGSSISLSSSDYEQAQLQGELVCTLPSPSHWYLLLHSHITEFSALSLPYLHLA